MPYDLPQTTHDIKLPACIQSNLPVPASDPKLKEQLIKLLATSYVRREGRFFHIDRPGVPLTREDLQRSFLCQAQKFNDETPISKPILKEVFNTAITEISADTNRSIPVWTGRIIAYPGSLERRIPLESGQFDLNAWVQPAYRAANAAEGGLGCFRLFFDQLFPRKEEQERVLDWLAWCLQNEGKKPNWAVMLYSQNKGTGKSTFCKIAARLFGEDNTSIENSLEKVAGKFNAPILSKKLVICEEVNLRPESEVGNKLKTLITEAFTTVESKGRDVSKVQLFSVFLLNSNHLPLWIEAGERRFYILDVNHDGHASGSQAASFGKLVNTINKALESDERVSELYHWLMARELNPECDPMALNTAVHGTDVMKRILANQMSATSQQLAEFLGREKAIAITEQDLRAYVSNEMRLKPSAIRHLMSEQGWNRYTVKWGGVDYARAIWTAPKYLVDRGNILGPNGYKQAVCDVLWDAQP